jgi:exodeoxyribonuclease-5
MTTATISVLPRLTFEQEFVIASLLKGVKEKTPVQTLGGYAGTGKTTVIRALKERLPNYAVCAFTGKAANVLRRKGVPASTIHSLIYEAKPDPRTRKIVFVRRLFLTCQGIVVDEASMVGRDIYNDLTSFGLPLIFVGDHGQLEPVNSDFNLMANPDQRLEEIHRNAGEISRFAEWVRKGGNPRRFPREATRQVEFLGKDELDERELWTEVDQIICAYNKTRVSANAMIRDRLGSDDSVLTEGERVMCLRNNRSLGVFNGMQGTVTDHHWDGDRYMVDFDSYGESFYDVPFHPDQFGLEKTIPLDVEKKDDRIPFDYAYCITCHKGQGDEFDDVMVLEQRCPHWDHKRWAYTAASRAREKVYWARGF